MMEIAEKYKQTEVGLIPSDWEVKLLSDVVEFLDGQRRPIKSSERKSGEYPYYGASGIIDFVDDYIFDDDLILLGEDGENILSRNLPLAFKVRGKIWVNNHAHVLKPKEEIDIIFLTAFLESLDYSLLNSGTAQPKLNKQACLNIQVVCPTKAEQTAIASALSDADALISCVEKLIAKKRNIKQGTMQQLLQPKEGWEVKILGESSIIARGGSPRPIEDYLTTQPDGINWIKIGDVGKGAKYIETTEEKIKPDGISRSRFVKEGDFLLSNSMSFGRPYILKTNGCIHDGWLVIQNYHDNFDSDFLYYVLGSEFVLNQYKAMASGSSVLNLNKEIVKKVKINCPKKIEEQTRIATILSDMDAEIAALENKLEKYRKVKLGMMQNLLTGKIRLI